MFLEPEKSLFSLDNVTSVHKVLIGRIWRGYPHMSVREMSTQEVHSVLIDSVHHNVIGPGVIECKTESKYFKFYLVLTLFPRDVYH